MSRCSRPRQAPQSQQGEADYLRREPLLGKMVQHSSGDPASKVSSAIAFSSASATNPFSQLPAPLHLNKKCRLIGCGMAYSFVVEKDKEDVWTWGLNSFGGTGIREGAGGNEAVIVSPTRVPALALNEDTISGGAHHSAATTANGKLLV